MNGQVQRMALEDGRPKIVLQERGVETKGINPTEMRPG